MQKGGASTTTTKNRQERERAILAAARKVFAAVGVERVMIARVANEAHIAPGTVYLYFKSKDVLIQTAAEQWLNEFYTRLRAALSCVGDPIEQLRRFIVVYIEHLDADPDFLENIRFALAVVCHADARNRCLEHYYVPYLRSLTGVIEAGMAQGILRKLDPEATAVALHSMLLGYCRWRAQRPGEDPLVRDGDVILDIVLRGLLQTIPKPTLSA